MFLFFYIILPIIFAMVFALLCNPFVSKVVSLLGLVCFTANKVLFLSMATSHGVSNVENLGGPDILTHT